MGQKNHSLALRIHPSGNTRRLPRTFDQIWYSDRYFSKLISLNLSLFTYFNTFLKLFKLPSARYSIHHYQKKTQLYLFFCYPRQSREYKSKIFHISSGLSSLVSNKQKPLKKLRSNHARKHQQLLKNSIKDFLLWQNIIKPSFFFLEKQKNRKMLDSTFPHPAFGNPKSIFMKSKVNFETNSLVKHNSFLDLEKKKILTHKIHHSSIVKTTLNSINTKLIHQQHLFTGTLLKELKNLYFPFSKIKQIAINLYIMKRVILLSQNKSISLDKLINQPQNILPTNFTLTDHIKYKTHLENYISQQYNFHLKFIPFKVNQEWQDAGYFADEIAFLLERRMPFRQLKTKVLNQLILNPNIRGLRITCSGRVGGKSKKAQRAKKESVKYGQTSLHIFSSKIDFAVRTAHTPLGSTGIKVWICYN